MTIQLGDIALTRLQAVAVDEDRNYVEFRVPGATGSVFQDLGRGALRLVLRGILLGEQALRDIETLRVAHADATPLSFSGDIAVGSELTDVIIELFEVHQISGHAFRYEYELRVREWTEPPSTAAAELAAVDEQVAADADAWTAQSAAIAAGLTDPGKLAEALGIDPSLLARIDMKELTQAVLGVLGGLDAKDFAHLLAGISGIDPSKLMELIESLDDADSLEDLFKIITDAGINLLDDFVDIDLGQIGGIAQAFFGSIDYVDRVREVVSTAQSLLADLRAFNPTGALAELQGGAP